MLQLDGGQSTMSLNTSSHGAGSVVMGNSDDLWWWGCSADTDVKRMQDRSLIIRKHRVDTS